MTIALLVDVLVLAHLTLDFMQFAQQANFNNALLGKHTFTL